MRGGNPGTGTQAARVRIGRRDIGIRPMVEVKEGGLGAFEQDMITAQHRFAYHAIRILHKLP